MDLSELSISFCVWDFSLSSEHINVELLCFAVLFFMSPNAKETELRMAATTHLTKKKKKDNAKRANFSKMENVWGIKVL